MKPKESSMSRLFQAQWPRNWGSKSMWQQRGLDHHSPVCVCGTVVSVSKWLVSSPVKAKAEWQLDSWEPWGSQAWPRGSLGGKGMGGTLVWLWAVRSRGWLQALTWRTWWKMPGLSGTGSSKTLGDQQTPWVSLCHWMSSPWCQTKQQIP